MKRFSWMRIVVRLIGSELGLIWRNVSLVVCETGRIPITTMLLRYICWIRTVVGASNFLVKYFMLNYNRNIFMASCICHSWLPFNDLLLVIMMIYPHWRWRKCIKALNNFFDCLRKESIVVKVIFTFVKSKLSLDSFILCFKNISEGNFCFSL